MLFGLAAPALGAGEPATCLSFGIEIFGRKPNATVPFGPSFGPADGAASEGGEADGAFVAVDGGFAEGIDDWGTEPGGGVIARGGSMGAPHDAQNFRAPMRAALHLPHACMGSSSHARSARSNGSGLGTGGSPVPSLESGEKSSEIDLRREHLGQSQALRERPSDGGRG